MFLLGFKGVLPLGCASTGGGDVAGVKTDLQAAAGGDMSALKTVADLRADVEASLAKVEANVGRLDASVAHLHTGDIGGGGDSVTSWIYALIAGAAVLYPLVWRPARLAVEDWQFRRRVARARKAAHARSPPRVLAPDGE